LAIQINKRCVELWSPKFLTNGEFKMIDITTKKSTDPVFSRREFVGFIGMVTGALTKGVTPCGTKDPTKKALPMAPTPIIF
jgi:hypothetical protein